MRLQDTGSTMRAENKSGGMARGCLAGSRKRRPLRGRQQDRPRSKGG